MITEEIEMLFNQQIMEYQHIQDLKEKLVKAQERLQDLGAEIRQKLSATQSGLTITALTDKGREALPQLTKTLASLA